MVICIAGAPSIGVVCAGAARIVDDGRPRRQREQLEPGRPAVDAASMVPHPRLVSVGDQPTEQFHGLGRREPQVVEADGRDPASGTRSRSSERAEGTGTR